MRRRILGGVLLVSWFSAAAAAEEVPAWMRQAFASEAPAYSKTTPAAVLLRETRISVQPDGKFVTTDRRVIRILSRAGRPRAIARAIYRTDSGKVRDLHAWLIPPSSTFKSYDKAVDIAAINDDVYNETRVKAIFASEDAEAGAVFGYEAITEEISPFTQFEWDFQDDLPAFVSRLIVDLPDGWTTQSFTFNHAGIEDMVVRGSHTWELHNLDGIEKESNMPSLRHLIPRLAVTFVPAPGAKVVSPAFQNWREVSVWLTALNDPQAEPTAVLSAKARELTAAAQSEFEKIQAIAQYVQATRYISIQTGIGRGGGYRPHAAAEIFAKSYGDCKDKVTLMRAMLKAIGITSYPIGIYSGDRDYVNDVWASPQQFNHAIIAIRISGETPPVTLHHPSIGPLMIFDPTDPDTPPGDLPEDEQGSFGLLVAGDRGELLRMPVPASKPSQSTRSVEVSLGADGFLQAALQEDSTGQVALAARRIFRHRTPVAFRQDIERWITQGVPGAVIGKLEPDDRWMEGLFVLKAEFKAAGYARLMNNRLLIFKPAVVNRRDWFSLAEGPRQNPILIDSEQYSDVVRVKLPSGFRVDEVPDPVTLQTSFGKYSAAYKVSDGQLTSERTLILQSKTLPPDQYSAVRDFFQKIIAAEQAAVVLIKN